MMETEVTNAQYKEYLDATGKGKDDSKVLTIVEERMSGKQTINTASIGYSVGDKLGLWITNHYPIGWGEHPVAIITLEEAQAFCKWLTSNHPQAGIFRLPTWNEWMIAAYGRDRNYPWGDEWKTDLVHMSYGFNDEIEIVNDELIRTCEKPGRTEPVKARSQGRTPEGLYGMLGNVAEYIVDGDPTNKSYFDLGSRWMGGDFSTGWDWSTKNKTVLPPRKDYWGYSHHSINRESGLGFRIVLDPANNESLLRTKRLFDQNDKSWMIVPAEKTEPNGAFESEKNDDKTKIKDDIPKE